MNKVPDQTRLGKNLYRFIVFATALLLFDSCFSLRAWADVSRADQMVERDHVDKGNYLLGRQKFDEALSEYEAALAIDANSEVVKSNIVLVHNDWGIAYFKKKQFDQARDQWREALKLNPYDRNARNNLTVLKNTLDQLGASAKAAAAQTPGQAAIVKKSAAGKEEGKIETATPPGAVILTTVQPTEPASKTEPPADPKKDSQPATPKASSTVTVTAGDEHNGGANLEEKLMAIEKKVYGKSESDLPILERIEKLERDTNASTNQGSISERIKKLAETYGL